MWYSLKIDHQLKYIAVGIIDIFPSLHILTIIASTDIAPNELATGIGYCNSEKAIIVRIWSDGNISIIPTAIYFSWWSILSEYHIYKIIILPYKICGKLPFIAQTLILVEKWGGSEEIIR